MITGFYEVVRGKEKITVGPGECFVAHEGDKLDILHKGYPEMRARYLHFRFSFHKMMKVDQCYQFPFHYNVNESKRFHQILDYFEKSKVKEDSLAKGTTDLKMSFALLEQLLALGIEVNNWELLQSKLERFLPLIKWLDQNLREKIDVDDIAMHMNLSVSRVFKLFKDTVGCTPMNYLKKIRMMEAQRLVISTDKSMEEISQLVGFNNPFHFSREFKNEYTLAPLSYRKQTLGV
ncbi:MAG: hypothetical protein COA79_18495 [Planctomycetota bacterium]|nr:MAG: hypothetical protein COA79_18495 [Planctomycetota bacterium]